MTRRRSQEGIGVLCDSRVTLKSSFLENWNSNNVPVYRALQRAAHTSPPLPIIVGSVRVGVVSPVERRARGGRPPGDRSNVYAIDFVIGHAVVNENKYYFVRWRGYDSDSDSWEPEVHLNPGALTEYWTERMPWLVNGGVLTPAIDLE